MSKKNKNRQNQNIHEEELTLSGKINNFLYQHRKVMIITFSALAVLFLAIVLGSYMISMQKANAIEEIETIVLDFEKFKTKELKNSLDELTPEEKKLLQEKEETVIQGLLKFAGKSSYVGYMANAEIAEIYYLSKNWEKALDAYEKASKCVPSSYAMGPALFNAAICAEEIGNTEKALEMYKKAGEAVDFPFRARSLFNAARLQEQSDTEVAIEIYNKIASDYANTEWAKLSKTRVIQLELKK
ncbi:MAG: hypothetical protein CR988_04660 [Treponema sp.]|nr:MAG: hypothetical protein CR988_04660 [Treponema sp.]